MQILTSSEVEFFQGMAPRMGVKMAGAVCLYLIRLGLPAGLDALGVAPCLKCRKITAMDLRASVAIVRGGCFSLPGELIKFTANTFSFVEKLPVAHRIIIIFFSKPKGLFQVLLYGNGNYLVVHDGDRGHCYDVVVHDDRDGGLGDSTAFPVYCINRCNPHSSHIIRLHFMNQ